MNATKIKPGLHRMSAGHWAFVVSLGRRRSVEILHLPQRFRWRTHLYDFRDSGGLRQRLIRGGHWECSWWTA